MRKASKIILTIIIVVVFLVLDVIIVGTRSDAGYSTPGPLGLITFLGLIGAIRAVWKKDLAQKRQEPLSACRCGFGRRGHHAGHEDVGGVGAYNNSTGLICRKSSALRPPSLSLFCHLHPTIFHNFCKVHFTNFSIFCQLHSTILYFCRRKQIINTQERHGHLII